jgi:hypothetical protein
VKDEPTYTAPNGVAYVNAHSVRKIEHPAVDAVTCAVTLPQFDAVFDGTHWTATVPYTPHVRTYLMGVPGYDENTPISATVTVTSEAVGGGQFWIRYAVEDGYVAANQGQWHIDFYSASAVTLPEFGIDGAGTVASATVPLTPHVKTFLYGVPGHDESTPISAPVTVTADQAPQFWVGYQVDDGYHAVNTGTSHIDFNAS